MMCFAVLLQIDLVLYCYMHFRVILLLILLLYYSPVMLLITFLMDLFLISLVHIQISIAYKYETVLKLLCPLNFCYIGR